MITRFALLSRVALGALLLSPAAALAQPVPKLNSLSTEWITRGDTVEVVFNGENLGAVTGFVFNGDPGLSATNVPPPETARPTVTIESTLGGISRVEPAAPRDEKRLVVRVTAAATASLTPREVRVVAPGGISNPLPLNVGHLPEVREKEPNQTVEQAPMIPLPVALSGAISAAAQLDHFRFQAAKGQELVFEVDAARRGSPLDSTLAILDASGKELARNEDFNGLDSLLAFTVPADGEYILQLRDFRYMGGGNFNYRLYAGALPYVESIFPFGGQRGKTVEVALNGRNLDGTSKMTLDLAPDAPLGRQDIRARTPKGFSNLVPFDVQEHADFLEAEPNDAREKANAVNFPVVINGRIGAARDLDHFKFKVDRDQKIVCEVVAQRFGSRLDALLALLDANGSVLRQNDDAAGADARFDFDAKKDVEYTLALRDLTDRGGEDFGYRLALRPPSGGAEAGFTARFLPDTPRVYRGGYARVRCEVARTGFNGPVRFAFEDLPAGVIGETLVLTTAPASGILMLAASPEASLGTFPIKLTATGVVGGKTVTRTAEPLSGDRAVRQAFLTVLDAAPFTLELVTLSAAVEQNQSATVEVLAQRRDGFAGDIKLSAEGFSAGRDPITKSFEVGEVTVKGGESAGKLRFKAKLDSEVGTRAVIIKGDATMNGQPVTQFSRPFPLTVSEVPFVISSTLSRLSVTALPADAQSAASETATTIKVDRRAGFTGEVTLALEGVPDGVKATLDKIPANAGETTLKLVATEKAPVGTNSITILGTGLHNDRFHRHKTGAISLVVSAPEPVEKPAPATAAAPTAGGTQ